ncbi:MAG: hypothetical protein R8G34_03560 [Paracoccaceae bacterium]|nr:hypothetical protein [Paracoccaceae bacterium]
MPELLVPSEGYPYISSAEAQWLAVETLFLCRSKKMNFDRTYLGMLSFYYKAWARADLDEGNLLNAKTHYNVLDETEELRHDLRNPSELVLNVILNDVQPLRMVLEAVLRGASKEVANAKVSASLQQLDAMRAEFLRDPEFKEALPRTLKQTRPSRLEGLWRQYADILHYVILWRAGYQHARLRNDLEPVQGEQRAVEFLKERFAAQKKTNPIKRKEPLYPRFVTPSGLAEKMDS